MPSYERKMLSARCLITADYHYRRPIFPHRRRIMCEKATWKMANYRRPPSTYRRPILLGTSSCSKWV